MMSVTEQYAEIKERHIKYLDELRIVDANLVRIRPLLEAEKSFNKLNGTKITSIKEEFRVAKDEQLRLYDILKKINEELRVLRPANNAAKYGSKAGGTNTTRRRGTNKASSNKAEERRLAKEAKAAAKEEAKTASKAAKEAKREEEKAAREARREARREELEFQNKPACGYNIPLLTDVERSGTKIMNGIFAMTAKMQYQNS